MMFNLFHLKSNEEQDVNPVGRCQYCGAQVHYKDAKCRRCGKPNDSWEKPMDTQCGNCHAYLGDGAYCRICGTKRGEGKYRPYQNIMQCIIYGPMPIKRVHTCQKCGYQWETCVMIDDERFCPKCGGKAPYEELLEE